MIIPDTLCSRVYRKKGGELVISFTVKPTDLPDLASRLVLESYADDNTPLTLVITEDHQIAEQASVMISTQTIN